MTKLLGEDEVSPARLRPREQLETYGSAAILSDSALLALLLSTGTREYDVESLAQLILAESGGLQGLSRLSWQEIQSFKGVGKSKGATIVAAMEIGRRLRQEVQEEQPMLSGTLKAAQFLQKELGGLTQEVFKVCLMGQRNELLAVELIAMGQANTVLVQPKDILRAVFKHNACAVILAHNHPFAAAEATEADDMLTKRLKRTFDDIGIAILDHIIIGKDGYYSFREQQNLG